VTAGPEVAASGPPGARQGYASAPVPAAERPALAEGGNRRAVPTGCGPAASNIAGRLRRVLGTSW